MITQTTFRSVAKPKVKILTSPLVGGQLPLEQGTMFVFSGSAVGTITSLLNHEYLIDGQPLTLVNAHTVNPLIINIGSFSKTVPAGYSTVVYYSEVGNSFYEYRKEASLKAIEDSLSATAVAIATEASARESEDLAFLKIDGTRALLGTLNFNSNFAVNVPAGIQSDHLINKAQLDTAVAGLNSVISASATALQWREKVNYITQFTFGNIPLNGDILVDSPFGAGNSRLFEDDDSPNQVTAGSIPANSTVIFLKLGQEPKKMVVRNFLGTKRWYDETESDPSLKLDRQITVDDTFVVDNDLLDDSDEKEGSAIYRIVSGPTKTALKIADFDWDVATGITLSGDYTQGLGGETVVQGDSIQDAVSKLDGNILKIKNDTFAAITQEISDRNSAIFAAISQEVLDRNQAIALSESSQNAKLASSAQGEGASLIGIEDEMGLYLGINVETALKEIREQANNLQLDIDDLEATDLEHLALINQNAEDIANASIDLSRFVDDLASTSFGKGASLVSVHDSGDKFTGTNVESVLSEIDTRVDNLNMVTPKRGLYETLVSGATTLSLSTDFVDQFTNGVVQDLSGATYLNAFVNRDGAMLIGGVGYTLSGNVITFTPGGGGQLIQGEIIEIKIIHVIRAGDM